MREARLFAAEWGVVAKAPAAQRSEFASGRPSAAPTRKMRLTMLQRVRRWLGGG